MDNEEVPSTDKKNRQPWMLIIATVVLLFIGLVTIVWTWYIVNIGGDNTFWNELSAPQSQFLVAIVTVYAAALAATLGPLIYTTRIDDMRSSNEQVAKDVQAHVEQLISQIDLVRRSVNKLRSDSLGSDAALDVEDIRLEIEGIQQSAARISEDIIFGSRKWESTKKQYQGLWPGRMSWVNKLYDHSLIDDKQWSHFDKIHKSRDFTRGANPQEPDILMLRELREELAKLKMSLE